MDVYQLSALENKCSMISQEQEMLRLRIPLARRMLDKVKQKKLLFKDLNLLRKRCQE